VLRLLNDARNATDEATVSILNSFKSGDPWDEVSIGAGGVLVADDAKTPIVGLKSWRIATGGTSVAVYAAWTSATLPNVGSLLVSLYLWFDAIPSVAVRVMEFRGAGGTRCGQVQVVGGTGVLQVAPNTGPAVSGTVPIAVGQWIRVDARCVADAVAGTIDARLHNDPASAVADDSVITAPGVTQASVSGCRFFSALAQANLPSFWAAVARVSLDDYPGPYVPPPATVTFAPDLSLGLADWPNVQNAQALADPSVPGGRVIRFDANAAPAFARLPQTHIGTDKRYGSIRFGWTFRGSFPPASGNAGLSRVWNTSDITAGGGGHWDSWADAILGVFRADLQPTDGVTSTVEVEAERRYLVEIVVAFNDDNTSSGKLRIDGVEVANFTSTTPAADLLRRFQLGSDGQADGYVVDYDSIAVRASASPLDYINPDAASLPTKVVPLTGLRVDQLHDAVNGDTAETGPGRFLVVHNANVSPVDVTIVTPGTVHGLPIADRVVSVPAGQQWAIPLTHRYRNPATGLATITYSSTPAVAVAAVRVPA
jgi:hypothetical protein